MTKKGGNCGENCRNWWSSQGQLQSPRMLSEIAILRTCQRYWKRRNCHWHSENTLHCCCFLMMGQNLSRPVSRNWLKYLLMRGLPQGGYTPKWCICHSSHFCLQFPQMCKGSSQGCVWLFQKPCQACGTAKGFSGVLSWQTLKTSEAITVPPALSTPSCEVNVHIVGCSEAFLHRPVAGSEIKCSRKHIQCAEQWLIETVLPLSGLGAT